MIQSEIFQPSWSCSDNENSYLDHAGDFKFAMDVDMVNFEFSSLFTTSEDSPVIPFSIPYLENTLSYDLDVTLPNDDFLIDMEGVGPILGGEIDDMPLSLEESEESFPSQPAPLDGEDEWSRSEYSMNRSDTSMDMPSILSSLTFPTEAMETDNQLSLIHLVEAYGEAKEQERTQLAEVIVKRMREKVSPVGGIVERLLYYAFQPLDKQSEYLTQESAKNFNAAFKAFYQIFPYGKFAHFSANLAILEAIPRDAEIIHIFDFDMGDGVQWSSMIEAIGCEQREVKLTSIRWNEEDPTCNPSQWKFEETKRRLYDHAGCFGLKLKVDEMKLHDLSEIKKMKSRGHGREWFAFNCMFNLPHMGRVRSRKDAMEFLRVAKELVADTSSCNSTSVKGVIIFGDGDYSDEIKCSLSFGSFLDGYLLHYQALLESMECKFPIHLAEARTVLECLFVSPFVSSLGWIQKWEERKECYNIQSTGLGLGLKVSKESLMEAKEMVREGGSLYGIRIEGENDNEMVLEWKGTPLVRVFCWRS